MGICKDCQHHVQRRRIELFPTDQLIAPGVLKEQGTWEQEERQRAQQEYQAFLAHQPFHVRAPPLRLVRRVLPGRGGQDGPGSGRRRRSGGLGPAGCAGRRRREPGDWRCLTLVRVVRVEECDRGV